MAIVFPGGLQELIPGLGAGIQQFGQGLGAGLQQRGIRQQQTAKSLEAAKQEEILLRSYLGAINPQTGAFDAKAFTANLFSPASGVAPTQETVLAGLKIAEAMKPEEVKAPTTQDFTEGKEVVKKQWNAKTGQWEELSRGEKFQGRVTTGDVGQFEQVYGRKPKTAQELAAFKRTLAPPEKPPGAREAAEAAFVAGTATPEQIALLGKGEKPGAAEKEAREEEIFKRRSAVSDVESLNELKDNSDDLEFFKINGPIFNVKNKQGIVTYWNVTGTFGDDEMKYIKIPKPLLDKGITPEYIQFAAEARGLPVKEVLRIKGVLK